MEKMKEVAAIGIFLFPFVALSAVVIPWAIFAPVSFCAGIDPNNSTLMDGWGGAFLRTLFFHCSWVGK